MADEFSGLPPKTFRFLGGLSRNNDKAWFEEHRGDYDAYYVEPGKALVLALGPLLQKFAPQVQFEPRVGGSIARVHRDVRFTKDKSPYKDHLDLWFWHGHQKGWNAPGFFFRLTEKKVLLGSGMHLFDKDQLANYRAAVLDPKKGAALSKALKAVAADGESTGEPVRKKVPRGFDAEHPRADLLKHDGLHAYWEGPVPKEARTAAFPAWCAEHFRAQWPVGKWLLSVL